MTTLQIDYYYAEDRIPGAVKMVKTWFFLKDMEKLVDRRK